MIKCSSRGGKSGTQHLLPVFHDGVLCAGGAIEPLVHIDNRETVLGVPPIVAGRPWQLPLIVGKAQEAGEEEVDGPRQDDDVVGVGQESHHGRPDPNAWMREQSSESMVEWYVPGLLGLERLVTGLAIVWA